MRTSFKATIFSWLAIALAAMIGLMICKIKGWTPHSEELLSAAIVTCAATILSLLPLPLLGRQCPANAAQAGLAAMVILLLAIMALAGLVTFVGAAGQPPAFVGWLLTFSWISLCVVCWAAINTIKLAELLKT